MFLATDLSNQADSEQRLSPDERRLATQRGSCIGILCVCMIKFLERMCVLWRSGRRRTRESGQNTTNRRRQQQAVSTLDAVEKASPGCWKQFLCAHYGSSALHGNKMILKACWVSLYLENEQEMLSVDGLGGYHPAARLLRGGCPNGLRRNAGGLRRAENLTYTGAD